MRIKAKEAFKSKCTMIHVKMYGNNMAVRKKYCYG